LRREEILEGKVPTAPTIASMMAALEVQEALKLLHGLPVEPGSALVFNGVANRFYSTQLPYRDDCLSHEAYPAAVRLPFGVDSPASALFDAAAPALGGGLTLCLDRDLVTSLDCPRCGWGAEVMKPRTKVAASEANCPTCHQPARPSTVSTVEADSPLATRVLSSLGVPASDVVRVEGENGTGFFRLR
jgi:adenylyltransferase/sulfurtransferase